MRFAGNFNPEWGYLAPAPSFIRTVRMVVVAAAIGATASAAVVFSLVDRPAAEVSVAARTLVRPTNSALARTASQAVQLRTPSAPAQATPEAAMQGQPAMRSPANAAAQSPVASESAARSAIQRPASIAALAEAPAATDAAPPRAVEPTPVAAPLQRKRAKRHHSAPRHEEVSGDVGGPLALLRSFSARVMSGGSWPYE